MPSGSTSRSIPSGSSSSLRPEGRRPETVSSLTRRNSFQEAELQQSAQELRADGLHGDAVRIDEQVDLLRLELELGMRAFVERERHVRHVAVTVELLPEPRVLDQPERPAREVALGKQRHRIENAQRL